MGAGRGRHLIFLAHVWASAPFAVIWLVAPGLRGHERPGVIAGQVAVAVIAAAYLIGRTAIAWRDRPQIAWNYVYPVPDVILISVSLFMARSPESVLYYTYALPIIAAASTLNVAWAATVGVVSVVGALIATMGLEPISHLGAIYRLVSLVVLASLATWLAKLAADVRARLSVADERNRIAMEMHDGVQAHLIAIASQMELAGRLAATDAEQTAGIAAGARDLARKAADDLRFLVHRLRASDPGEAFVPAVRQYLHNLSARTGLAINADMPGDPPVLGADVEHALFRILQEALNNVLKHAQADEARVTLESHSDHVVLGVADNGSGFDPTTAPAEHGHEGIEGMHERARRIGGTLRIVSKPDQGTLVEVTVPLGQGMEAGIWTRLMRR
jgi:signal transduction histidine kinase